MNRPRTRTGSGRDAAADRAPGLEPAPLIDCREQEPLDGVLVLKEGRTFALLDPHGEIRPAGHCGLGLFRDDTRYLSHLRLEYENATATLLSSQTADVFEAQFDFALLPVDHDSPFASDAVPVHVSREILVTDGLYERVQVRNYGRTALELPLRLTFASDFADIFEVRGWRRDGRGSLVVPPTVGERRVERWYEDVAGHRIGVAIEFTAPPDELGGGHARWVLHLPPLGTRVLGWKIVPLDSAVTPTRSARADDGRGAPDVAAEEGGLVDELEEPRSRLREIYADWRSDCTRWVSSDAAFNRMLEQATTDLRALHIEMGGKPVIAAGIPWYSTAFGRDALITSLQTLPLNPDIARQSLRFLAHHQGSGYDAFTGEEPGKIMHELRRGEMARAREIPHLPYYGTIDATPLWVILLHETWRWTGDDELLDELYPNLERAIEWLLGDADPDGDGFVEYVSASSPGGLRNQGWKDSLDGVSFPDGTPVSGPIALVEVQGYAYDALLRAGRMMQRRGDLEYFRLLSQRADRLRKRVQQEFWLPDLESFALALDGNKHPVPTLTSNAGHLLWSRLPGEEAARCLRAMLMRSDSFNGWGIRTLSDRHPVYNPMSYHNGSLWPHDNALVGLGMSFYGDTESAMRILEGQFAAARFFENYRLPELFCGFSRIDRPRPVSYPVSCNPQAWAAGAVFMLLQATTGLLPEAAAGVLHVREPMLPAFLSELRVEGLRVGGSVASLEFRRREGRTTAVVLDIEGDPLRVEIRAS